MKTVTIGETLVKPNRFRKKAKVMENFHPNQTNHQETWRSTYMTSQASKQNKKGAFTKALAGRHYEDSGLEAAKRRVDAEKRQMKRIKSLEEHTKNVTKLQEEALEVQAQLEEIQHRNRLKSERAEKRRIRYHEFCSSRLIQTTWRQKISRKFVKKKKRREISTICIQRLWRGTMERKKLELVKRVLSLWMDRRCRAIRSREAAIVVQKVVRKNLAVNKYNGLKDRRRSIIKMQAVTRGQLIRSRLSKSDGGNSITQQQQRSDVQTFVTSMCEDVFEQCGIVGVNVVRDGNLTSVVEVEEEEEEGQADDMSFEFSAPKPLMPKLSLASLPKNGQTYHEEFMSNSTNFSLSWREELLESEKKFEKRDEKVEDEEVEEVEEVEEEEVSTARTDGGTVVQTIRRLRLQNTRSKERSQQGGREKERRERPKSSPVRRTTKKMTKKKKGGRVGGGFTGVVSGRQSFMPSKFLAQTLAKQQEQEERANRAQEEKKMAMQRVAELEEKRYVFGLFFFYLLFFLNPSPEFPWCLPLFCCFLVFVCFFLSLSLYTPLQNEHDSYESKTDTCRKKKRRGGKKKRRGGGNIKKKRGKERKRMAF